jgi:hypothetical protein
MSRRSARVPAQPHRLADEQASHRYQDQDLLDLRRATEQSLAPDDDFESDEEAAPDDESSSSEEEEEEKENVPPQSSWAEHTQDIKLPPFTEQPASNLPRHRPLTEMGYLQRKGRRRRTSHRTHRGLSKPTTPAAHLALNILPPTSPVIASTLNSAIFESKVFLRV